MDISYSLVIEDHIRINPLQGLDALIEKIVPAGSKMQRAPKKAEVKTQNEQSMMALQSMLSNVSNAPVKRKPRRA